jgi:hypothetical protein
MTEPIDAIPTDYAGTTFRSRLEADWAATLDGSGIRWQYEPELITLPSGTTYLPDFWLPEIGTWLEVKGPSTPRKEKATELGQARACHCAGPCTCQWPGGELVLLGWPSEPANWTQPGRRARYGYASWASAHGPSAYLIHCRHCATTQWITLRRPWKCRACRAGLEGQQTYRPVDQHMPFASGTGLNLFRHPDLERPVTDEELAALDDSEDDE